MTERSFLWWGQWPGEQPKAYKEQTAEHGVGKSWSEKLLREWKRATISEKDHAAGALRGRAAGVDAERWVRHVVIMDRRMAAAEYACSDPKDNDAKAPVKA